MSDPNSSSTKQPFWLKENTGSALPQTQTPSPPSSRPTPRVIIEASDGSALTPETIEKIQRQPGFAAYIDKIQKLAAENKEGQGTSNTGADKPQAFEWVIPEAHGTTRDRSAGYSETEIRGEDEGASNRERADLGKDGIGDASETIGVEREGNISFNKAIEVTKEGNVDSSEGEQVTGGA